MKDANLARSSVDELIKRQKNDAKTVKQKPKYHSVRDKRHMAFVTKTDKNADTIIDIKI